AGGSKPSVPSLPSIQRTSTQPASGAIAAFSGGGKTPSSSGARALPQKAPSQPPLTGKLPSSPPGGLSGPMRSPSLGSNGLGFTPSSGAPSLAAPGRSNLLVFTLVGILVAAIVVLAYLVLTK